MTFDFAITGAAMAMIEQSFSHEQPDVLQQNITQLHDRILSLQSLSCGLAQLEEISRHQSNLVKLVTQEIQTTGTSLTFGEMLSKYHACLPAEKLPRDHADRAALKEITQDLSNAFGAFGFGRVAKEWTSKHPDTKPVEKIVTKETREEVPVKTSTPEKTEPTNWELFIAGIGDARELTEFQLRELFGYFQLAMRIQDAKDGLEEGNESASWDFTTVFPATPPRSVKITKDNLGEYLDWPENFRKRLEKDPAVSPFLSRLDAAVKKLERLPGVTYEQLSKLMGWEIPTKSSETLE